MNFKVISGIMLSLCLSTGAYAKNLTLNCNCTEMKSESQFNCKCTKEHRNKGDKSSSLGQTMSDSGITTAVKSKLLIDKETSGLKIGVETTNDIVTLTGTAASVEEKQAAERIARDTKGVHDVKNNIEVATETQSQ